MINIQFAPLDLLREFIQCIPIESQKCYENCGTITLLQDGENDFSLFCKERGLEIAYCLGLMTDCFGTVHPHAWIKVTSCNHEFFCDPTLQVNSPTWKNRKKDFKYQLFHTISKQGIVDFFMEKYKGRDFNAYGVPNGLCQYPIVNMDGEMLCVNDIET